MTISATGKVTVGWCRIGHALQTNRKTIHLQRRGQERETIIRAYSPTCSVISFTYLYYALTRKPSLEVAPTTLAQRTRKTAKNTPRRNVRPQPKKEHFLILWAWTLNCDLDIHLDLECGQEELACQISRSTVI